MIAKISTNTRQIISILILLSWIIDAWDWGCLGAPKYTLSFKNCMGDDLPTYDMKKDEMTIRCGCNSNIFKEVKVKPNPEASYTFCGGWFVDPKCNCHVSLSNSNWNRKFNSFNYGFDCKREKHCRWKIRRNYPHLFAPSLKKYLVQRYYIYHIVA